MLLRNKGYCHRRQGSTKTKSDVASQHQHCHRSTEARKIHFMDILNQTDFPLKEETDLIIGLAIEVHKILGPGFL